MLAANTTFRIFIMNFEAQAAARNEEVRRKEAKRHWRQCGEEGVGEDFRRQGGQESRM